MSHTATAMRANPTRLYADVEFLTSIQPARNYLNLASLDKAADYIKAEFKKLGVQVEEQPFRADGRDYRNIIASFGPPDAERIVLGAHYDVCGEQLGADDKASAVAGLLETARLLHEQQPLLNRRLDLVAYPNEEPPYFAADFMGSAIHAYLLHLRKVCQRQITCTICPADRVRRGGFPKRVRPTRGVCVYFCYCAWQGLD